MQWLRVWCRALDYLILGAASIWVTLSELVNFTDPPSSHL